MPACPGPTARAVGRLPVGCRLLAGSADGLAFAGGGVIPCAAVVSRVRKLLIWPIALIIGDGNITMVFFSTPSSASVCKFRSRKGQRRATIVSNAPEGRPRPSIRPRRQ